MIRTQIDLTEEQATALREIAADEGRTVEDIIRESVDVYAASHRKDRKEAAIAIAGRFRSGAPNLGVDHDHFLTEDFGK